MYEAHSNDSETLYRYNGKIRLRRVPGLLPIRLQNLLHRGEPEVQKGGEIAKPRFANQTYARQMGSNRDYCSFTIVL